MLELLGCDYAQGYHFRVPMGAERLLTGMVDASLDEAKRADGMAPKTGS